MTSDNNDVINTYNNYTNTSNISDPIIYYYDKLDIMNNDKC